MLVHHLFYNEWSQQYYNDFTFQGVGIVNQIGIFSKLCVAVFVFASGYGLAVSTPNDIKLKDFYWHRFKKLYLNYWFIWMLFVPIGVFVFGRSFTDAYGDNAAIKGILDFFGLLKMFGADCYNPTWWFYSCIIILYLLFPIFNKYLYQTTYFVICVAVVVGGPFGSIPVIKVVSGYLLVFIVGMMMSRISIDWVKNIYWWQILMSILLLSGWRLMKTCPRQFVESLICAGMALFVYKVPMNNWIGKIFTELGKHSMNMFLIHTFIYYYWFRKYIYITHNPLLIFISLVLASYFTSLIIEWIKDKVKFYNLLKYGKRKTAG